MAANNHCNFIGNLTKAPEGRTVNTKNGELRVLNASIAINNRRLKDSPPSYVDLTFWGKQAEVVEQYCKKGHKISVQAEVKQDTFEDKETGKTRKAIKFTVLDFELLTGKKESEAPAAADDDEEPARPAKKAPSRKAPEPEPEDTDDDFDDEEPLPF